MFRDEAIESALKTIMMTSRYDDMKESLENLYDIAYANARQDCEDERE